MKHFRQVATRFEKRASNYRAMIKSTSVRVWIRAPEPVTMLFA
ncbi:MAG: hypothetical protein H8E30_13835 [Alphaproteobacteria bacterium]|nr:hypothetical protein [Alphaproteobacteria bacterium]